MIGTMLVFNKLILVSVTGNVVGYSGLIFALLNEVSRKLNFTYMVIEPPDKKWGIKAALFSIC